MSCIDILGQDDYKTSKLLDVVEKIAEEKDWASKRDSDNEIIIQVPGSWCNYSMFFIWNSDVQAIHFTCAFDMRVQQERLSQVYELLATINEEIWLGHFGLWNDEGLPMFRHTLLLRDTAGHSRKQIEDVINISTEECDRFYPAFNYVIWGGKSAKDAVSLAIIETEGEA